MISDTDEWIASLYGYLISGGRDLYTFLGDFVGHRPDGEENTVELH